MSSYRELETPLQGENLYISTKCDNLNKEIKTPTFINGEGTDILNNPSLEKRAKRKVISRSMVLSLIDIAKAKGDTKIIQSYWNAYHCQNNVIVSDNKLYGKYCKNRFCTVCSAIRKAEIINKYYPEISTWKDVQFLTLTVKAQPAKNLKKWIDGMITAFNRIQKRCKKRNERGTGPKIKGIKSLECNFNPKSRTYNPHFHIIVEGLEAAEILKKEWMQIWTKAHTYHKAQYIRPVKDLERDLIETIKYGSKIFTEYDVKKKTKTNLNPMIYARALHNIFMAMSGKRIFDRFGFNLPMQKTKKAKTKLTIDYDKWVFLKDSTDWINLKTGECLTGYLQSNEIKYLLNQCINSEIF